MTFRKIVKISPLAVSSLVLAVFLAAAFGCATAQRSRPPAVAIAVRSLGDTVPSQAQVSRIHQALQPELTRAGYVVADSRDGADFIVTVTFVPTLGGQGGRVRITGFEPTRRFREATDAGDTAEAKEWRRRQREMEAWIERQHVQSDS